MSQDNKKGFTLIELTLAMGFVSALLIAIVLTVIQIGNIYNKGITMKEVNQSGRTLSDELQRSIAGSSPFDLNKKFIDEDWGGRLCVGKYSYVWNYGESISSDDASLYKYLGAAADAEPLRFVKIQDKTGSYCVKDPTNGYPDVPVDATELLSGGDRNLVLHSLKVTSDVDDPLTQQQLYFISFSLGTMEKDLLTADNESCKPPDSTDSSKRDFSYCAVNRFDIVARAGNIAK